MSSAISQPNATATIITLGDGNVRISQLAILKLIEKHKHADRPNYEAMVVKYEPLSNGEKRFRKKHLCIFCFKDYSNLKRRLKDKHKNEQLVIDMKAKCSVAEPGSREPIKELIYLGDYVFNIDARLNNGTLRVARETTKERSADDFNPCDGCFGLFFCKDYAKHRRECTGLQNNGSRGVLKNGRKLLIMCSKVAEERLRFEVLPNMRHDHVFRAFRYDDLIIEYGNEICDHLRDLHHNGYVMNQLRRLGTLKILLKLKKFEDIVFIQTKTVLRAIKVMAKITPDRKRLENPTVAQNMATLIKKILETHMTNCYDQRLIELGKTVKRYVKVFARRYSKCLSKLAADSHTAVQLKKKVVLPSKEDLRMLLAHLQEERIHNYNKLLADERNDVQEYDFEAHKDLMKAAMTSLQVSIVPDFVLFIFKFIRSM